MAADFTNAGDAAVGLDQCWLALVAFNPAWHDFCGDFYWFG